MPIVICDHVIQAEVADTRIAIKRGLMFRNSLPAEAGMLLIFPATRNWGLWMKNTRFDLGVAFIDEARQIIGTADMLAGSERPVFAPAPYRYALEVNAGWFQARNVGVGDHVLMEYL